MQNVSDPRFSHFIAPPPLSVINEQSLETIESKELLLSQQFYLATINAHMSKNSCQAERQCHDLGPLVKSKYNLKCAWYRILMSC